MTTNEAEKLINEHIGRKVHVNPKQGVFELRVMTKFKKLSDAVHISKHATQQDLLAIMPMIDRELQEAKHESEEREQIRRQPRGPYRKRR